jgi:tetratricopeptide (TPR) repeat protein
MASRVNVRFVTMLATVLLALFLGMAATAWFVLRKSAEEQMELGDQAMAAGDYKQAQNRYGRAISKKKANVEYYEKFRDALAAWNPEHDAVYLEAFYKHLGSLERIATLRQTDVDAHRAHLDARLSLAQLGADRAGWESIAGDAERALINFEYADDLDDETARRWPALRRYRALAYKEIVAAGQVITPEESQRTVEDFEAALSADPSDVRLVIGLVQWHWTRADRAADAGGGQQIEGAFERVREALEAGLAASPDNPELLLIGIQLEEQLRAARIDRLAPPAQRYQQQRQIAADLAPKFDALVERLLDDTPAEAITQHLVMRLRGVERYFRPEDRNALTLRLIDRALEADGNNASLRLIRGAIDSDFGRIDDAIAQFQKIVEAPRPPVSLEGVLAEELRVDASSRQAGAALAQARSLMAGESGEAAAAIARAAGFRDDLASRIPAGTPAIKLVDAEIAFLRGDAAEANRLLSEYTREAGHSAQSVRLHAEVLDRLNQPGAARDEVKRLTEMSPRDGNAFLQLGRIEERLQNWSDAEQAYDRALELAPWSDDVIEHRRRLRVRLGREQSEDPVEQAIANWASFAQAGNGLPPDPGRARKVLEGAIAAHGDDPRLIQALLQHHVRNGQRELGAQIALDAADRNPENEVLAAIAEQVRLTLRSVEERLAAIDSAEIDEEIRLASRYDLLRAAGRTEEAAAEIDALARLNPDNAFALDHKFVRALQAGDDQTAAQIAERAARVNADQAGGLTFRGRLLLERGRAEEAVEALSEAVARGAASVEVRRLLAVAQLRVGQPAAAISTLKQAVAARPGDLPTIMQTLEVLIGHRQYEDALHLARESEAFGGYDADFVHTWLELESRVGDKEIAGRRRELILRDNPDDRRNRVALARLYVDARDPRTPQFISQLRADGSSLVVVDLDARWRFAQGDLDGARQVYREYLAEIGPDDDVAPDAWFSFAGLLSSAGDTEGAIAALSDARAALGDRGARADLALARLYAGLGRFAEAASAYQRVLDGGGEDPQGRLRIGLAEVLTLAGKGQEALDALARLPADLRDAAPAQVVRSDAIRLLGREQEADERLNDAIARTPTFAGGFLKRGQIALNRYRQDNGAGAALIEDALADLNKSLELDPSLWPAYQIRAEARLLAGNLDGAVRDADRAIAINPSLSNLRLRLIEILLDEERYRDAERLADNAARTQSTNLALLQAIGDRLVAAGRQQQAVDLYKAAWEASRAPAVAARIVEVSLRSDRPDLRLAREILSDSALNVEDSPMLLMLRAQLESKAGRQQQMRDDALKSLALVLDKPAALSYWIQQSGHLFDKQPDWLAFLKAARLDRAPGGWGAALLGAHLAQSPQTVEDGVAILRQASSEAPDPAAAAAASRDLGSACFSLGRHADAVAAWQRALELQPDDPSVANNIAFTLADALGRPAEALPFALSAAEASPQDPTILDTLGVVQARIGQFDAGSETLQRALQFAAGNPGRMAPVLLHLAQLEAERGDKGAAENYLTRAREALGSAPGDSYRDLISGIQNRIDQL